MRIGTWWGGYEQFPPTTDDEHDLTSTCAPTMPKKRKEKNRNLPSGQKKVASKGPRFPRGETNACDVDGQPSCWGFGGSQRGKVFWGFPGGNWAEKVTGVEKFRKAGMPWEERKPEFERDTVGLYPRKTSANENGPKAKESGAKLVASRMGS